MLNPETRWSDVADMQIFLALDYSQIEIRMLAEVSGDKKLLDLFRLGRDIHCLVGAELTGLSEIQIANDKVIRTFIKGLHFGIIYGLTAKSLHRTLSADPKTKDLGYTLEYVQQMYDKYFARFRGVKLYMERTWAFAQEHGYIETLFGFRRYIGPEYEEDRDTQPENQSKNAPIQGAAHQLLLNALALLHIKPRTYDRLLEPIMEVHDAIVWRMKCRHLHEGFIQAKELLEEGSIRFAAKVLGYQVKVPLVAEASVGFRYGTMVEYDAKQINELEGNLPSGKVILRDLRKYNAEVVEKIQKEYPVKVW
jgi:DNA polymerase-1